MSRPPLNPDKTLSGIILDPQTLQRVIPESKRTDGSVRKEIKIRPGFTPQEDVRRFRGTKQAQMDTNALPKGHIIGWAPPPSSSKPASSTEKPLSKSAKKNAKRKEKRQKEKDETVPDDWEDDAPADKKGENGDKETAAVDVGDGGGVPTHTAAPREGAVDEVAASLENLKV